MRRFTQPLSRLLPYAGRAERLVDGPRPSRGELLRYYATGPEGYWLSCLDGAYWPEDPVGRFRIRAVLDLLGPGDYSTFLDVGCGSGIYLAHLLRRWPRARALALDISRAHLRAARGLLAEAGVADRCSFVQGDAEALPLRGTFDAIFCVDVIEHLLDPEKLLARLGSLCHFATRLVVSVPQIYMGGKAGTFELEVEGQAHRYFHDQFELPRIRALLAGWGFRMEECLGVHFTFPRAYPFISYAFRKATAESATFDRVINRLTRNRRAVNLVLRCSPAIPREAEWGSA